jgi:hypothetical protein
MLTYSFIIRAWSECSLNFGPYLAEAAAELAAERLEAAGYQDVEIECLNPAHMLLSPDAVVARAE